VQSHAVQQADLETDVSDAVIEPDLPEEPELDVDTDLDDQAQDQPLSDPTPPPTPAERAFDLLDAGKLGEADLLAAAGVTRDGYVPDEAITHRALDAVEHGRLIEAALIKLLGN